MTTQATEAGPYTPVKVHVESVAADVALGSAPQQRKRIGVRAYTVVLTSTQPVDTILDKNEKRLYALVQAGGNDVIINNNKSEIQNAANQATGLPNPIGYYLPYGNTGPVKIPGGQHWYASAAAYPAQITVLAVEEE